MTNEKSGEKTIKKEQCGENQISEKKMGCYYFFELAL